MVVVALVGTITLGALISLAVAVLVTADMRRGRAIGRLAGKMDFQFVPDGNGVMGDNLGRVPLFTAGRARAARNLCDGMFHGKSLRLFDYEFQSDRRRRQTVAVFDLGKACLPSFVIWPKGTAQRQEVPLADNASEVNVKASPQLAELYCCYGGNAEAVRHLLRPAVIELLTTYPDWSVEGRGRWLVLYRFGRPARPRQVRDFCREAVRLQRAFRLD